jgi:peptide-methionine (S)-S-oxide reductase
MQIASFAGGCFWGMEAAFRALAGVTNTAVGYSGGQLPNPTYRDVCSGRTGHCEVVRVEFDPERVFYAQLLEVFWRSHDPAQRHRPGSQYQSLIFVHDAHQEHEAKVALAQIARSGRYAKPILTEIRPATVFYLAEDYHQQFLARRGAGR